MPDDMAYDATRTMVRNRLFVYLPTIGLVMALLTKSIPYRPQGLYDIRVFVGCLATIEPALSLAIVTNRPISDTGKRYGFIACIKPQPTRYLNRKFKS